MIFQDSLGVALLREGVAIGHVKGSLKGFRLGPTAFFAQEQGLPLKERIVAVRLLIEDFRREHRIGHTEVFLGVPPDLVMTRTITLPMAVRENLRSALTYEMEKYVPLPADEIYFDHPVIGENKANNRISVLLAVVKRKDFDPFLDLARTLPGGISGIEPLSSAAVSALSYLGNPPDASGVAGIMKGGEQTADWFRAADPDGREKAGVMDEKIFPCFGLALRGLAKGPASINLIPAELRRRPSRISVYLLIVLMAAALVSGLFWGGSYVFRQRLELTSLRQEAERLSLEVKKIEALTGRQEQLRKRIDEVRAAAAGRVSVLEMLRELSQVLPETAWIRDLNMTENKITIDGVAQSAADIVPLLESSPLFQEAVFLSAITREKDGRESFRIGFTLTAER